MKKLKLYENPIKGVDRFAYDWDKSLIFRVIEVEDNVDIWSTPMLIDGKFYYCCCSQGDCYKISELDYFKFDSDEEELETFGEDEITCPVCGSKQSECWEYSCDRDEHTCENCGSKYEWERHIEVTYSSQATKIGEHIEINYQRKGRI